jgi:Domain of unknown function (DUF927)
MARDAADGSGQSGDWGKLIRSRIPMKSKSSGVITLTSLHSDPGALIGSLAYWGVDIKCTLIARRLFVEYLASVDVKERVTVARRNGSHDIDGARAFALPGEIINGASKERVILAKEAVRSTLTPRLRKKRRALNRKRRQKPRFSSGRISE